VTLPNGRRFASGAWLRCVRPRPGAHTTLLALPHAGGSAVFFHSWGPHLPDGVELTAVQYPGRLDRLHEPCLDDVHDLAAAVVDALRTRPWPLAGRRLALLGHSMGALVAFETALRLEALGVVPVVAFLSSHPAPGRPVRGLPPEFTDEALLGELRRLGGTPAALLDGPDLRDVVLAGMRSDYRAVATYRPSPGRLSSPIVCFVGDADPDVCPEDMLPWAERTGGAMVLSVFPGEHFYLVDERDAVLRAAAAHLAAPPATTNRAGEPAAEV
jgi:pyochelin biosynthetic protein PchC